MSSRVITVGTAIAGLAAALVGLYIAHDDPQRRVNITGNASLEVYQGGSAALKAASPSEGASNLLADPTRRFMISEINWTARLPTNCLYQVIILHPDSWALEGLEGRGLTNGGSGGLGEVFAKHSSDLLGLTEAEASKNRSTVLTGDPLATSARLAFMLPSGAISPTSEVKLAVATVCDSSRERGFISLTPGR